MKMMSWAAMALMICCGNLACSATPPQPETTPPQADAHAQGGQQEMATTEWSWPREFSKDGKTFSIYQPQVEKWAGGLLEQRAAVSVQMPGSAGTPLFGVVWMTARTEVDKTTRRVDLSDVKVTKVSFPSGKDQEPELKKTLQAQTRTFIRPITLDRLEAALAVTKAQSQTMAKDLKNDAPKIIYSSQPAVLIPIDGKPVLRDSGTPNILRVVNTRALLLFDQSDATYYLHLGDRWMKSGTLEGGSWTELKADKPERRADLDKAKQLAEEQGQVDLIKPESGTVPNIIVSTAPAELVQTNGTAQFEPVAETHLLYVKNSGSDLFLNTDNQRYYLLASGRWYSAQSLDAQWSYVPPKQMPADFAKIPNSHPKGDVLASIPGTEQAEDAVISNSIPQTATVDRTKAGADIKYDGQPKFIPIEGTPLKYATNTPTPVIQVSPTEYYCVQNGVWFTAPQPTGPWAVATAVPQVIYTIPPSSPVYYATYVYVYGWGPRWVYVGYLPGYLGSYVTPDGVVVYGTGYWYQPWIGSYWIGPPFTFGIGIGWGWGWGWNFHVGWYAGYYGGTCFAPWWGPWYGGWYPPPGPVLYGGGAHVTATNIHINRTNIYQRWASDTVASSPMYRGIAPGAVGQPRASQIAQGQGGVNAAPGNAQTIHGANPAPSNGQTLQGVNPAPSNDQAIYGTTPAPNNGPAIHSANPAPPAAPAQGGVQIHNQGAHGSGGGSGGTGSSSGGYGPAHGGGGAGSIHSGGHPH